MFCMLTNRYDEEIVFEDVQFFGPSFDRIVASLCELGVEECVESVHFLVPIAPSSGHNHLT
jgi:hypothetical protein